MRSFAFLLGLALFAGAIEADNQKSYLRWRLFNTYDKLVKPDEQVNLQFSLRVLAHGRQICDGEGDDDGPYTRGARFLCFS